MAVTMDLMPTFAGLAKAAVPSDRIIDGKDIAPILMGDTDTSPHECFYYYFRGQLDAVRHGKWKLFAKRRPQRGKPAKLEQVELYDLQADIGETNNVATANPDVVAKLEKYLVAARKDLGDAGEYPGDNTRKPGEVENPTTLTMSAAHELTQTDVFMAKTDGYHTYRIPSLLTTPAGTLLATCEGRKNSRSDHGNLDLVLKRSEDLGMTWSPMTVIYEEGGDKNVTIGNPCPVVDQETGTIWMPFCRDNKDVFMTHSTDDGKTWSKPTDITTAVKKPDWGWYATGPGVGIQMTRGKYNGRMVIPCDHREKRGDKWIKNSHVFFSDDHGKTWELGATVDDHTDECQVVELHDGRLMINMRNYWHNDGGKPELGRQRAVALSNDGGESWEATMFDEALIESVCQASLIKHSDDVFRNQALLFSNPASKTKREKMTVRVSMDQGKTWPHAKIIHKGPAAYSSLAVLPDRSIGCLYEAGEKGAYETLRFARFTIPWLSQD